MNQANIEYLDLWRSLGNTGDLPVGWHGPGGGSDIPPFEFSFEEAEKAALEELRPYYERILSEEQGDVERAKRRIEEDYARGIRYREEDLATREREFALTFPREETNLIDSLNKRGLVPTAQRGGLGSQDIANLQESQNLRREAVSRALQRQGEEAGLTRSRSREDLDTALSRREFELGEEKKEKALGRASQQYGLELARYGAERSRYDAAQSPFNLDSARARALARLPGQT